MEIIKDLTSHPIFLYFMNFKNHATPYHGTYKYPQVHVSLRPDG
jgi:hypothetical protein